MDFASRLTDLVLLYNVASSMSWKDLELFWGRSTTTLPRENANSLNTSRYIEI